MSLGVIDENIVLSESEAFKKVLYAIGELTFLPRNDGIGILQNYLSYPDSKEFTFVEDGDKVYISKVGTLRSLTVTKNDPFGLKNILEEMQDLKNNMSESLDSMIDRTYPTREESLLEVNLQRELNYLNKDIEIIKSLLSNLSNTKHSPYNNFVKNNINEPTTTLRGRFKALFFK